MNASSYLPILGLAVVSAPAGARGAGGDPAVHLERLISEGDLLPGVGTVEHILDYLVTDAGTWYVRAFVDSAGDSDLLVLIRDGVVVLSEHDPVLEPPGATIDGFFSWDAAGNEAVASVLRLYGTVDYTDDHIALVDDTLLAQESKPASLAGVSPGTVWRNLVRLRMNDERQVLVMGELDDPALPNPNADALVRYDLSITGVVFGKSLQLIQGAAVAGAAEPVATISETEFRMNDHADVLALVTLDATSDQDAAVVRNGAVVAREGGPSILPGHTWPQGKPTLLDLNARADVCFLWAADVGGAIVPMLVRNEEAFVLKGDVLQATAPLGVDAIPWAALNDRGDLVWQANWDPVSPLSWAQKAVFLNTKPLARKNVSVVAGETLLDLNVAVPSAGGRYVLFTARTTGQVDELYRVDLGPWSELDSGALGGVKPAPALVGIGALTHFAPTTLRVEGGTPGATAAIVIGLNQVAVPVLGTTLVPEPAVVLLDLPIDADGAAELSFAFPPGLAPGANVYAQAFVPDAGAPFGWSSSNAIVGVTQ